MLLFISLTQVSCLHQQHLPLSFLIVLTVFCSCVLFRIPDEEEELISLHNGGYPLLTTHITFSYNSRGVVVTEKVSRAHAKY